MYGVRSSEMKKQNGTVVNKHFVFISLGKIITFSVKLTATFCTIYCVKFNRFSGV